MTIKLSIKNVGLIKSASFELRPLTIFVGPAGTNKTWTAYIAYAFLRYLSLSNLQTSQGQPPKCFLLDEVIKAKARNIAAELSLNSKSARLGEDIRSVQVQGEALTLPLKDEIAFSFDSSDIATVLGIDEVKTEASYAELTVDKKQFLNSIRQKSAVFTANEAGGISVELKTAGMGSKAVFIVDSHEELLQRIESGLRWVYATLFGKIAVFPAERKGIDLMLDHQGPSKDSTPTWIDHLSLPIRDYLIQHFYSRSPFPTGRISSERELFDQKILRGFLTIKGRNRRAVFRDSQGNAFELSSAASLVKSLAGLDLYLERSFPASDFPDAIVIDEPEMNAHPEAQIMLAEFFATLANRNRHVIMTTHSPYLVDHFNNLLLAGRSSDEMKEIAMKFLKLGSSDSFLDEKSVSAYLFSDSGIPVSIFENGEIDVQTFGNETDGLANFYANIHEVGE